MSPYRSLFVLMDSNGSIWVFMGPYESLLVLMASYMSLCVLWVLIGP